MQSHEVEAADLDRLAWDEIPAAELDRVDFKREAPARWWRIDARMLCAGCGALQEVDSDPTNDQAAALRLALALFRDVGWRKDVDGRVLCSGCAAKEA